MYTLKLIKLKKKQFMFNSLLYLFIYYYRLTPSVPILEKAFTFSFIFNLVKWFPANVIQFYLYSFIKILPTF